MKKGIFFLLIIALVISISGMTYGQYFYYYPDGSQHYQDVYDTLVAVGFRSVVEPEADMYAIEHSYLQNYFDFKQMPGDFTIFGIESGYSLDSVIQQIRTETGVYMVNPVIIGTDSTPIYATNQAVAYFDSNITEAQIDSLNEIFHFSIFATVGPDSMYYYLEYTDSTEGSIFDICNEYYETGMVRYIYPHFVYKLEPESEPNDPYFGYQWHLNNTGQDGGTVDADIDMPEAWELTQPKYTKRLAIIDFGFEMDHGDFANDLLMWPYDCVGADYKNPVPDYEPIPECDTIYEHCFHGTMMLGLIAPIINNSQGLAGIIDSIQIVPVKFADKDGHTTPEIIIDALDYCMTSPHNANAICCAWSLKVIDEESEIAINQKLEQLYNHGHPVFFAAGNVILNYVRFPACSPWVMSVSATDHNDNIRYSYKPGTDTVDLRAPGVDLWSFDLSGEAGLNPEDDFCNWDEDYYCHYTGS